MTILSRCAITYRGSLTIARLTTCCCSTIRVTEFWGAATGCFSPPPAPTSTGRATAVFRQRKSAILSRSAAPNDEIIILDCCHSGAFAEHAKAAAPPPAVTGDTFSGADAGLYVLTAADALQFAWDGADLRSGNHDDGGFSQFTSWLVEGLEKGAAAPEDEQITIDALYRYLFRRARSVGAPSTPQRFVQGGVGDLIVARNPLAGAGQIDPATSAALESEDWRVAATAPLPNWRSSCVKTPVRRARCGRCCSAGSRRNGILPSVPRFPLSYKKIPPQPETKRSPTRPRRVIQSRPQDGRATPAASSSASPLPQPVVAARKSS